MGCTPDIYIDYAHIEKAMEVALRYFSEICEHELIVVFGCGGKRDRQKCSRMGALACYYAEHVILCDDNPHDEDSLAIIDDIRMGCDGREEVILNRQEAIKML